MSTKWCSFKRNFIYEYIYGDDKNRMLNNTKNVYISYSHICMFSANKILANTILVDETQKHFQHEYK